MFIPVGVDAEAYDVPLCAILFEAVEDKVEALGVGAAVDVDDNLCVGVYVFHGVVAGASQFSVSLHVLFGVGFGPYEAVGCLVAYLHPSNIDVGVAKELQGMSGVLV